MRTGKRTIAAAASSPSSSWDDDELYQRTIRLPGRIERSLAQLAIESDKSPNEVIEELVEEGLKRCSKQK